MKNMLKATALLGLAALTLGTQANAALIVHDGSISRNNTVGSIDYFRFTTTGTGVVTITANSVEFDPMLYLFSDTGSSITTADIIASDDDSGTPTGGPAGFSNSLLSLSLAAGSYVTAVGDYFLSSTDAANEASATNTSAFALGNFFGAYQLTINGDFVSDPTNNGNGDPSASVSEPMTFGLFGLALAGLGALRRKKV